MKALWLLNRTTEVKYDIINVLGIHIEMTKKVFPTARVRIFSSPTRAALEVSFFLP